MRSSLSEHRLALSVGTLTQPQVQMDAAVATLGEEASNVAGIASIVAGGLSYRASNLFLSRLASPLLTESGLFTRTLTHALVRGSSLAVEVSTFRGVSNGISSLSGHAPAENVFHLQGWAANFSDFLILKGLSPLAAGRNMVLGHFVQANGMVLGHEVTGRLGLTEHRQSSYLQQLAEAEALNMKLALGMSLVGVLTPAVARVERRMEVESGITRIHTSNLRRSPQFISSMASEASLEALGVPEGELPLNPVPIMRDRLPGTEYFNRNGANLPLAKKAGYARSHTRHRTLGDNSHHTLWTPFRRNLDYAPYGGGNVERMNASPEAYLEDSLTPKFNTAAVFSPSTAVLGFGAAAIAKDYVLRAIHGQPIMVGKKHHFEQDGIINTSALCGTIYFSREDVLYLNSLSPNQAAIEAHRMRAVKFAEASLVFSENFGFRNYEDVRGPDQPIMADIFRAANHQTRSAYWFDDTDGTGIITMMGVLSWLDYYSNKVPGRNITNMRGMFSGAGAGTKGVYEQMVMHGAQHSNLLATDTSGVLFEGKKSILNDRIKNPMAEGIPEGTNFDEFARGADFWINLGSPSTFTDNLEWTEKILRNMGPHPLIGLLTNPETGLTADWIRSIRPDAQIISGNQEFIKDVGYVIANNFGAFTYTGRGSLWAGATEVTPAMIIAAARGGAELAKLGPPPALRDKLPRHMREFGPGYMIPPPDDVRLLRYEARPVSYAALEDGVSVFLGSNPAEQALARAKREVDDKVRWTTDLILEERERLNRDGPRYFNIRFQERHAPFALREGEAPLYDIAPEINAAEYQFLSQRMGVRQADRESIIDETGEVRVRALTELLTQIRADTIGETAQAQQNFRELTAIAHIADICPALALALAKRRTLMLPEELALHGTVFGDPNVMRMIEHVIPEDVAELRRSFPIPREHTPE